MSKAKIICYTVLICMCGITYAISTISLVSHNMIYKLYIRYLTTDKILLPWQMHLSVGSAIGFIVLLIIFVIRYYKLGVKDNDKNAE